MAIEFRCVSCQKMLRVSDEALGKKARCPDCGTIQEVRGQASADATPSPVILASGEPLPGQHASNPFGDRTHGTDSSFDSTSSNPYSTPNDAGSSVFTDEVARARLQGPAIGMLVVAIISLSLQILGGLVMLSVVAFGNADLDDVAANVFGSIVGVGISTSILIGARRMSRLESYSLAITAAILSILPCHGCCIFTMPFGIWALVVLMDPQIRASFRS